MFSYLDIERQYHSLLGYDQKEIAEELRLIREYLDAAEKETDPQLCLRQLRRIAANIVRCLENHQQYSDQQEQRDMLGIPQEKQWTNNGK